MLRIGHAILHVFDFESGSTFFSERELDLDNRQTRSYVTRRLRRIRSSAESKHGTFAPESKLSRAMAVTVLYRMAGEPEVTGTVTFTDVKEDAYYYQALVWAVENGITTGMDDTRFAPNANVTREQMVTFLYRYAKASGADVSKQADLSQYRDVKQVSEYAEEAMAWAVGSGILQGMEQNLLAPRGTATRAQAAAILMRYSELA